MKGVVTRVLHGKGYGFIKGDDGLSRFFNAEHVAAGEFDLLREGKGVEFLPVDGEPGKGNGLRAREVHVVG
jgi:cold shock CspA family protein